jgi:hypothetical protein
VCVRGRAFGAVSSRGAVRSRTVGVDAVRRCRVRRCRIRGRGVDRRAGPCRRVGHPIHAARVDGSARRRRLVDMPAALLAGARRARAHPGDAAAAVSAPMSGVMRSTVMAPAHRWHGPSHVARVGVATPKRRREMVIMRTRSLRRDASGATRRPMIPQAVRLEADPQPKGVGSRSGSAVDDVQVA